MQGYFAIVAFVLVISLVLIRSVQMRNLGITAFHFGEIDKKDFLIPPFVFLYIYLIVANTFDLPRFSEILGNNSVAAWIGAALCILAPALFLWGMISFGKSFRVGIDLDKPNELISTGAFSISRNPLYVAFFMILTGVYLIFPHGYFLYI